MGIFSYTRIISAVAMRRSVSSKTAYTGSPFQTLMLASTPNTTKMSGIRSLVSECSLSEAEIKNIIWKVLESIRIQRLLKVLLN